MNFLPLYERFCGLHHILVCIDKKKRFSWDYNYINACFFSKQKEEWIFLTNFAVY